MAGLNWLDLIRLKSIIGRTSKINNEPNIAITPNNFEGIERNIA
jgi:hypothetical protein